MVSVFDVSQTVGKELPKIGVDVLTCDVEQYKDFFAALEKETGEGATKGKYTTAAVTGEIPRNGGIAMFSIYQTGTRQELIEEMTAALPDMDTDFQELDRRRIFTACH